MAWNVTGQLFELCNCNVVCGCWFGPTKPDQGWCGGALIFAIHQGAADGINLGGRKIALAAEWPGDFWSGNGKARLYVDAEASAEQRRELEAIFGGKRGGVPQNVLGGVITQWLQPRSVRIDVQSGDSTTVTVGEVGRVTLTRLKDGAGRQTKVQGAAAQAAFEIDAMDVASSKGSRWSDPELRAWEGDSGNVMAFGWKG
jgi:hypothetical protein